MSKPEFMSRDHVDEMNEILMSAPEVLAASRGLERRYALCYELSDGPAGEGVCWSMVFSPRTGVRMGLDRPQRPDLVIRSDWAETIRSAMAQRRGDSYEPAVELEGDPEVMEKVGPAYAAAQRVASIDVTFPELPGKRSDVAPVRVVPSRVDL